MVQGRSTKVISMMRWIRTSRLSIKKSLLQALEGALNEEVVLLSACFVVVKGGVFEGEVANFQISQLFQPTFVPGVLLNGSPCSKHPS